MCLTRLKRNDKQVAEAKATTRLVVIVVFDGVKLLDAVGPAEVFAEANRFGANYSLEIASVDGRDVATSIGTPFAVTCRISSIDSADTVMVAGGDNLVGRPIDPALIDALKNVPTRTRRLAICVYGLVHPGAGGAAQRPARHHALATCSTPRPRLPRCGRRTGRNLCPRRRHVYLAGVSSGIDLALALVEMDYGPELVREVARSLVVYLKRAGGQSQFSVLVETDPPPESALKAVTDAVTADPGDDHSVKKLAARASLSTRQLTRMFQSELGMTPARYVEMIRVDFGHAALDAGRNVTETAHVAGFGSTETLRRVFLNHLGITPKAYRDRFHTTSRG